MSPLKREFYPSIRQIRARDRENPADQSAAANTKAAAESTDAGVHNSVLCKKCGKISNSLTADGLCPDCCISS